MVPEMYSSQSLEHMSLFCYAAGECRVQMEIRTPVWLSEDEEISWVGPASIRQEDGDREGEGDGNPLLLALWKKATSQGRWVVWRQKRPRKWILPRESLERMWPCQ